MNQEYDLKMEFERLTQATAARPLNYSEIQAIHVSAIKDCNKRKNRYLDVLPIESTRVILNNIEGENGSDYINANFIRFPNHDQKYICAQAPLPGTFGDFWRMVWEQNITIIVVLMKLFEHGKIKGHHYWPTLNTEKEFYGINIKLIYSKKCPEEDVWIRIKLDLFSKIINFILKKIRTRILELRRGKEVRRLLLYQYKGWPDFGVPNSSQSIRKLIMLLNQFIKKTKNQNPILIHCSAGIGRTGTFLAILLALKELKRLRKEFINHKFGSICERSSCDSSEVDNVFSLLGNNNNNMKYNINKTGEEEKRGDLEPKFSQDDCLEIRGNSKKISFSGEIGLTTDNLLNKKSSLSVLQRSDSALSSSVSKVEFDFKDKNGQSTYSPYNNKNEEDEMFSEKKVSSEVKKVYSCNGIDISRTITQSNKKKRLTESSEKQNQSSGYDVKSGIKKTNSKNQTNLITYRNKNVSNNSKYFQFFKKTKSSIKDKTSNPQNNPFPIECNDGLSLSRNTENNGFSAIESNSNMKISINETDFISPNKRGSISFTDSILSSLEKLDHHTKNRDADTSDIIVSKKEAQSNSRASSTNELISSGKHIKKTLSKIIRKSQNINNRDFGHDNIGSTNGDYQSINQTVKNNCERLDFKRNQDLENSCIDIEKKNPLNEGVNDNINDQRDNASLVVETPGFLIDLPLNPSKISEFLSYDQIRPDIYQIVYCLRKQRNRGMVQTLDQYTFIYRTLSDFIKSGETIVSPLLDKFIEGIVLQYMGLPIELVTIPKKTDNFGVTMESTPLEPNQKRRKKFYSLLLKLFGNYEDSSLERKHDDDDDDDSEDEREESDAKEIF